ncbi:MAG: penicillin-binding protein activator [Alphaproteobacteria bacterium]
MSGSFLSHAPAMVRDSARAVCAIAAVLAIALLAACSTAQRTATRPTLPPLPPRSDLPTYFRLPSTAPDHTPVRIALILPFSSGTPETRAVAHAIERAAEIAVFDSGNPDIILMPRDDGGTTTGAQSAAGRAIAEGAEIILGPLFAQSVAAVGPIARTQGVPVIAFSTDRSVGGDGVYLLSFQPEDEVNRIITFAARQGRSNFAALVPQTAYGEVAASAFQSAVARTGARVTTIQTFVPKPEHVGPAVAAVAATRPDAVFIAQGGVVLRSIAPTLALEGVSNRQARFLGTGLWDDPSILREPMLAGAWFAAPSLEAERAFAERYRSAHGALPPRIASLGYDAVSLVALLSRGRPYQRFSPTALTDPNGFRGVDGIFRFHIDGSAERGLAVMEIHPAGFVVVSPAPGTFVVTGS